MIPQGLVFLRISIHLNTLTRKEYSSPEENVSSTCSSIKAILSLVKPSKDISLVVLLVGLNYLTEVRSLNHRQGEVTEHINELRGFKKYPEE